MEAVLPVDVLDLSTTSIFHCLLTTSTVSCDYITGSLLCPSQVPLKLTYVYNTLHQQPFTTRPSMASFSVDSTRQPRRLNQKQARTFVEQDEAIGEGDSELVYDILPPELAQTAFEKLRQEVQWQAMKHRGGEVPRLVAQQGEVSPLDGR